MPICYACFYQQFPPSLKHIRADGAAFRKHCTLIDKLKHVDAYNQAQQKMQQQGDTPICKQMRMGGYAQAL